MKAPKVIVIDFETDAIEGRPAYPPKPVGFSIKWPHQNKANYYAWAHPTDNNCHFEEAKKVLSFAWVSKIPLLFQNAKFDYDVATTHMGMSELPWELIHDTLYLIFLADPHATSYALKPAAERFLGMPPTEQQAVRDWLVNAGIVRKNDARWGAHISKAPGDLVGKYADGDTTRTFKLFNVLYPAIVRAGVLGAYDRERELMPILLENERQGLRVDLKLMEEDYEIYTTAMGVADNWIRKRLGVADLNVDSNDDLAGALDAAGIVTEWATTKTGKRSTAKKNLTVDMFNDPKVASVLSYRNKLATCMGTFIEPWLETARKSKGYIYTNWNQVRQSNARDSNAGTRTGRLSSTPNFQNIPKAFEGKDDGYEHPKFIKSLPRLPEMRKYILPDKGEVFLRRDYNQQELRILAHFEDDKLRTAYLENPRLDMHNYVRDEIQRVTGRLLDRSPVKIINFGLMYGMGQGKLADSMRVSVDEARTIIKAHRMGVPGVAVLEKNIKKLLSKDEPIVTWGGRVYCVEPPKKIDGQLRTFEYKGLNYLIQGSAADCTKQAIINYHKTKKHGRFLACVHDEICISAPKSKAKEEMRILKEAMESVQFDVPMLSDGELGSSWGNLLKEEKK
jgi:DNA polymerase-1